MSERYYSVKELVGLPGIPASDRGVRKMADRENWPFREKKGKGGGKEYPETCLPKATQKALQDQRVLAVLADTSHIQPLVEANPLDYMSLTDRQRHVNDARIGVLAEVERMMREVGLKKESAIHGLLAMAQTGSLEPFKLKQLKTALDGRGGKTEAPSVRTIKRWFSERDNLAPKVRQKNLKWPVWADAFLACYRKPQKPSVEMAYAEFIARRSGDKPSIHQVRYFLDKLPEIDRQKGRMGPREIKNIKPFVRRDFEQLLPNDIWSADGHTFDAEVSHPFHGRPFRPEITSIIDVGDRYVVGFSVGLAESSLATVDALRYGITLNGVPRIFYVDNGSGYANDMLKNEATGILSRFGIDVRHSLPYNSQARGVIERLHRTLWVAAAKTLPSYIGKDMDLEAAHKFHKESRRGDKNGVIRLPISWQNFMQMCEDAINAYNHRPHSSLPKIVDAEGRKRPMSPAEYRQQKMAMAGYEHHSITAEEADSLFRPRQIRKVDRGEIRIFGNTYFHRDLGAMHSEEVQVGYDVHDGQYLWVYNEDGLFVCKAEFRGNATSYMEIKADKRRDARIKRIDAQRDEIEAERKGALALEVLPVEELPGMRTVVRKLEERATVGAAATIPPSDQPQARYLLWRDLDARAKAGEEMPEAYRAFYHAFPNTAAWRSWNAFYNHEPLNAVR